MTGRVPGMDDPRRLSPSQARIARLVGPLDGTRIPGGCDTCDAYQTVEPVLSGWWNISVHHDDWCPTLAAMERRR